MTEMKRFAPFLLSLLLISACAQPEAPESTEVETSTLTRPDPSNPTGNEEGTVPPDWTWRFDREGDYSVGVNKDSSDVMFVTMTPGWHMTSGPAGIYYHPARAASGNFTATTMMHLFPPGERNEAYGLFIGGTGLAGPDQSYLYFLIRRSGEFLVKRRMGSETSEVIGWTASEAVIPYTAETQGTAANTLSVKVEGDMIHFLVNETEVASTPRGDLPTDGIVGLRVNHGLNMHIEDFSVVQGT